MYPFKKKRILTNRRKESEIKHTAQEYFVLDCENYYDSHFFPQADDIAGLCESNRRLQTDIQMYLNEIDMYKNGQGELAFFFSGQSYYFEY